MSTSTISFKNYASVNLKLNWRIFIFCTIGTNGLRCFRSDLSRSLTLLKERGVRCDLKRHKNRHPRFSVSITVAVGCVHQSWDVVNHSAAPLCRMVHPYTSTVRCSLALCYTETAPLFTRAEQGCTAQSTRYAVSTRWAGLCGQKKYWTCIQY